MDGDHPRARLRSRFHGACHLIRDVVEFQIEKDAMPLVHQAADQRRPLRGEQMAANLQPADAAVEAGGHLDRLDGVVHVERD